MIYEVIIPDLGATGDGMKLTAWLVKPDDFVRAGLPLFAVTTDKAEVEVEAFRDGYIREIIVDADSAVTLGTVVAVLADSLEESLADRSSNKPAESPVPRNLQELAKDIGASEPEQKCDTSESRRILASPLARRIAQERGIDLASVQRAGNGGNVHKRDILNVVFAENRPPVSEFENTQWQVARRVRLTPMRKAIAERTKRSKTDVPHFYVTAVVDVSDTLDFLKQAAIVCREKGWIKPSLTDIALRAAALALGKNPRLNSSFQEGEIIYLEDVNIGLVVSLDDGMIVPVVKNANRKDLYALANTRRQLQEKAKAGNLSKAELTGSTFTISNLGTYGVENFIAVINPPEAAILALGAAKKKPSMHEGQIVPRDEMTVTLSADHRSVDGVAAAQFLRDFKNFIENPLSLAISTPIHSK